MEKNANYALVGLSTVILLLAGIAFVFWLGRVNFARDNDVYDILFPGPLRGLSEGGEVYFNGIKVGEVVTISLDESNPANVIVRAQVDKDMPIRTDSYASLEPQGITGLNYVQITGGTIGMPLLKDAAREACEAEEQRGPCVPLLHSQSTTLSDLIAGGGTVMTQAIEALNRVNQAFSDENIRSFSATIANAEALTSELAGNKAIVGDAQLALQKISAAATEFAELSDSARQLIDSDGKVAVANFAAAAAESRTTAAEVTELIAGLKGPIGDFAATGLPQVTEAVIQLQNTARALEALVNELQSSPASALGKGEAKDIKVRQ